MKEKISLIWKHFKQGSLQKIWLQTLWIYQYGKHYWKSMLIYTLLGLTGTVVSLISSLISKEFGRYYYRSSNRKISKHLYCND